VYTYERLIEVVQRFAEAAEITTKIVLNLGSGGNDYGVKAAKLLHFDLAELRLPRFGMSVVGTAESLPFKNEAFDTVLFVGTVLNYCDAVAAISEMARVLKPGGHVLLEFESSAAAEYLWRSEFGKASAFVTTTFQGGPEVLWLYNPSYIMGLLKTLGISIVQDEGFHVVTGLIYRVTRDDRLAARFANLDRLISRFRPLRKLASNRVFFAQKRLQGN